MNTSIHPTVPPPLPAPSTPETALRIFASALGVVLLGDFLLWPASPGVSWGLFLAGLGTAMALNRPRAAWTRRTLALCGLLLATAAQSAVEISFSNGLAGLALLVALVGETYYTSLRPGWERVSQAIWAVIKAPGRWFWASGAFARLAWTNAGAVGSVVRAIRIALPALILGGLFAAMLGSGNAIFGSWISKTFNAFWKWLEAFDFTFVHLLFYGLLVTVALVVLHPASPGNAPALWTRTIPTLPALNPNLAWWRSVAILAVLNALFFAVNTIDALYLWRDATPPAGVTYSQFVHEGASSLICAVLLSGVVLALLFQQAPAVSQTPALRRLGYVWIAQNFILIAGVLLRIVRYVHACQLTLQRVYLVCFVLLVAAGFGLLCVHIARQRSLNWLLLSNALATLTLFFLLQFPDVTGWVARYNVDRWERGANKVLDLDNLQNLGSPAWPALGRVAVSGRTEAAEAANRLKALKTVEKQKEESPQNWRTWQAREARNRAWLLNSPF